MFCLNKWISDSERRKELHESMAKNRNDADHFIEKHHPQKFLLLVAIHRASSMDYSELKGGGCHFTFSCHAFM
jgi:hypothetical protein